MLYVGLVIGIILGSFISIIALVLIKDFSQKAKFKRHIEEDIGSQDPDEVILTRPIPTYKSTKKEAKKEKYLTNVGR